jgi:hypothetical protein
MSYFYTYLGSGSTSVNWQEPKNVHKREKEGMRIREAEWHDAAAMARVSVESYRVAHRDQIPEENLMQFTSEESERN